MARTRLSSAQQDEIIQLYSTTDTPIPEILATYNVGKTTLYGLLDDRKIPRRDQAASQGVSAYHAAKKAANGTNGNGSVETPVAPERDLAPTNGGAPMAVTVDSQQLVQDARPVQHTATEPEWVIEFTGTISVHAENIDTALREARKLGVVKRIVGINLKR